MNEILDFLLLFLAQFAGGPGPPENNLVRFGLAAVFWGILLFGAWSRQRNADFPREKLLVFGFGLGFLRELFMLSRAALRLLNPDVFQVASVVMEPIEHILIMTSLVVISGSFLRYILDDALISRHFLRVGFGLTMFGSISILIWWPQQLNDDLDLRFSNSGMAWFMHFLASLMLAAAMVILIKNTQGWLRNVVLLALFLFFLSELLTILNLSLPVHNHGILCPISNALYIWTIPLFGYIYYREQGVERQSAEVALAAYRDHLEELVESRTVELIEANKKLELTAILEERQRIAAEMHDGLAQTLSYMSMKIDGAAELLQEGFVAQGVTELDRMQHAIGQATLDVRRSISTLREKPQPRQSLRQLLEQIIEERTDFSETAVQLIYQLNEPYYLPSSEFEQIKPLVSEALSNADRHGQAKLIKILVDVDQVGIKIVVADDGIGFAPENQLETTGDHFGISIMKARAARIGGNLNITSQPGLGTEVILHWKPNGQLNLNTLQEFPS